MKIFRYTLLADGSSDAVLMAVIDWLISQHRPDLIVQGQLAENLGDVGRRLYDRVPRALQQYPCDVFFIHRDSEGEAYETRLGEITEAVAQLHDNFVPIIPMRMTEAWLLSDEAAIRSAAGNRSGKIPLEIPSKKVWERLQDPKENLMSLLRMASGKNGRALDKFRPLQCRHLVAQRTGDFSELRGLDAFDKFEHDLIQAIRGF